MFSELDPIAALREPNIILKNRCVQPRRQEWQEGEWGGSQTLTLPCWQSSSEMGRIGQGPGRLRKWGNVYSLLKKTLYLSRDSLHIGPRLAKATGILSESDFAEIYLGWSQCKVRSVQLILVHF